MENLNTVITEENHETKTVDSTQFQQFIYEIFETNGIFNDLRAYLRGQIVNILKNLQTGEPLFCQKNFAKRLELQFQALNILVADYLMSLEFSYSLSVFVSEVPLANMVFGFARRLLNLPSDGDVSKLRLDDDDVCSVLNYLGVKCDAEQVTSVLEMYKREQNSPLLLCILKCLAVYNMNKLYTKEKLHRSSESLSDKDKSSLNSEEIDPTAKRRKNKKCKHCIICRDCQSREMRLKEKYRMKKEAFTKRTNNTDINFLSIGNFMRDVGSLENRLTDELFEELQHVYEAEVEMVREEERKNIKRSLASHALLLQKRRDELEESYKEREKELEKEVDQKKKFLWGLARTLRQQHEQMSTAMNDVKRESELLTAKEENLKTQLTEAEKKLRDRAEDMRKQISEELLVLERNLESMRREKEDIERERSEIENMKISNRKSEIAIDSILDTPNDHHTIHMEIESLRKYMEKNRTEVKRVSERSVVTDLNDINATITLVLNKEHDIKYNNYMKGAEMVEKSTNHVINNLKKNNVNISNVNLNEVFRERSRERSHSSASTEADGVSVGVYDELVRQLREENENLRGLSTRQSERIAALSMQQTRLEHSAWLHRPRTAPTSLPRTRTDITSVQPSRNTVGWCKGAGEEMSLLANERPARILRPGDAVPFVGVVDQLRNERRHMIWQWRHNRRRTSPIGSLVKIKGFSRTTKLSAPTPLRVTTTLTSHTRDTTEHEGSTSSPVRQHERDTGSPEQYESPPSEDKEHKGERALLLETIESKINIQYPSNKKNQLARDKSPDSVLREAKSRLRKLEIEAEAVEKSYMDFRKRQTEIKGSLIREREIVEMPMKTNEKYSTAFQNESETEYKTKDTSFMIKNNKHTLSVRRDFNKYFLDYRANLYKDEVKSKNSNRIKSEKVTTPEHKSLASTSYESKRNYLETPLIEFRKFYCTNFKTKIDSSRENYKPVAAKIGTSFVSSNDLTINTIKDKGEVSLIKQISVQNVEDKDSNKLINDITLTCMLDASEKNDEKEIVDENDKESGIAKMNINNLYEDCMQMKNNDKKTPESLDNKNINFPIQSIDETKLKQLETDDPSVFEANTNEIEVVVETNNKIGTLKQNSSNFNDINPHCNDENLFELKDNENVNLLRVDVENVIQTNSVVLNRPHAQQDKVLLLVQSSADERAAALSETRSDELNTVPNLTMIVSPKENREMKPKRPQKSLKSPELKSVNAITQKKLMHISEYKHNINDDFQNKQLSENDISGAETNFDEQYSKEDNENVGDYTDDFSADVDNYNSGTDLEEAGKLPLKISQDDFWES